MAYIVKVTIEDTHPPVWRRIVLPEGTSFAELHRILQIAFGWEEEHMHDFTFPTGSIQIIQRGETPYGDWEYEEKAVVGDFLPVCKWIRYTYDFGDDWKHKIVLEKTDESYQEQTAVVIKAKGDGFEEDSGGVWASETRIPFDITEVNARLQEFSIRKKKGSEKSRQLVQQLEVGELLRGVSRSDGSISVINRLVENLEEREKKDADAAVGDMLGAVTERGRMLISWLGYAEETLGRNKALTINMQDIQGTMEEAFLGCGEETLAMYSERLQLQKEQSDGTNVGMAHVISQYFHENPQYFLYFFQKSEYEFLKKLHDIPVRRSFSINQPEEAQAVAKGLVMGLLNISLRKRGYGHIANLSFTKDAADIFASLSEVQTGKLWSEVNAVSEQAMRLLKSYGMMERHMLQEELCSQYSGKMEEADINRVINWRLCWQGDAECYKYDGKDYILMAYIDARDVIAAQKKYGADEVPIKKLRRKALISDVKELCDKITGWHDLENCIQESFQCEDELDYWLEEIYESVQDGSGAEELWMGFQGGFELTSLMVRFEVWMIFVNICMKTPLPMLKAYSREEYARLSGRKEWELGLFRWEELDEDSGGLSSETELESDSGALGSGTEPEADDGALGSGTEPEADDGALGSGTEPEADDGAFDSEAEPESDEIFWQEDEEFEDEYEDEYEYAYAIFQLPPQLQYEIYKYMSLDNPKAPVSKLVEQTLRQMADESNESNESNDFLFLLALIKIKGGCWSEAEKILKGLRVDDESVVLMLQLVREAAKGGLYKDMPAWDEPEDFSPKIIPFHRVKEKVGRNDPCPCGSGKKFKKCCYGKGIYD